MSSGSLGDITNAEYVVAIGSAEEKTRKINEILEASDVPEEYKTSTQYFRLAIEAYLGYLRNMKMYVVSSEFPNSNEDALYTLLELAEDSLQESARYLKLAIETRP